VIIMPSDVHQWGVQISEGPTPPPEIPWVLIAGAVGVLAAVGIGVYVWKKKK